MLYYKRHERQLPNRTAVIIALCDEDLVGKKLRGKNTFLDLDAYRSFYIGNKLSLQQARELIADFFQSGSEEVSFNLVGKESLAAVEGFVDVSKARKIQGVPHLQVYRV